MLVSARKTTGKAFTDGHIRKIHISPTCRTAVQIQKGIGKHGWEFERRPEVMAPRSVFPKKQSEAKPTVGASRVCATTLSYSDSLFDTCAVKRNEMGVQMLSR